MVNVTRLTRNSQQRKNVGVESPFSIHAIGCLGHWTGLCANGQNYGAKLEVTLDSFSQGAG